MNVPLLDLGPQLNELREEIVAAVTAVIDSTRYIMGPEVEAFEKEIAAYSGTAYGVGVSSGTDALLAALMALGIGAGDRVITTPYTFFATMGVILRTGAIPVFADIDPITYGIDPVEVERIIEEDRSGKIKAIIPVHLFGQCADMQKLVDIADRYQVSIIEDGAQAIGAEMPFEADNQRTWHRAGSVGTVGCFSFFPSKNLGGIGDGGMTVTNDENVAEKLRLMRNHGAFPKYYHAVVGGNFRLDPVQATVLRIKLKHLESWHQKRRENAERYQHYFHQAGLISDENQITLPVPVFREAAEKSGAVVNYHIYNQYIIRAKKRDSLRKWLAEHDIGTEIYYPLPLHQQACFCKKGDSPSLPYAEEAAAETLALPIYPELTVEMQEFVVETIRRFYH